MYIHIYIYTYMYIYIYIYTYIHRHTYIHTRTHRHAHIHTHTHTHTHTPAERKSSLRRHDVFQHGNSCFLNRDFFKKKYTEIHLLLSTTQSSKT